jgi:hypothetical protein
MCTYIRTSCQLYLNEATAKGEVNLSMTIFYSDFISFSINAFSSRSQSKYHVEVSCIYSISPNLLQFSIFLGLMCAWEFWRILVSHLWNISFIIIIVLEVHCDIYKSSYNISNISYMISPPPPFSFISSPLFLE